MSMSFLGLENRREAGRMHRGAVRSEESRQRMRDAAKRRPQPETMRVPQPLLDIAIKAVRRGATQREAAKRAGVSLGALQRALKRADA